MLVLIRVFHTICWKVYNVPPIQLREFLLVRYYLKTAYSSRLTLNWRFLFERNSTIALPSAALPYLYSWAGVETPAWTWATDPPTAISASPRDSVSPEVKVSGSFLLAYGLQSLRCHCWDQKRAWTALFGLQLAYDWRLLKEKKRKGGAKKGLLPILNKGLKRNSLISQLYEMHFFTLHLRRMKGNPNHRFFIYMRMQNKTLDRRLMKGNWCLMKNPRFIESGRTAGNRLPSPGKVKKAVSKPATDLENGSPPFRVKKGVGALRHKPYYSSNSVSSPPQGKEQSTHEQVLNSNGTRG